MPQRIRFGYEIDFSNASLGVFPSAGAAPKPYTLNASINILGQSVPSLPGEFFLLGGDDPCFANLKRQRRQSLLSQPGFACIHRHSGRRRLSGPWDRASRLDDSFSSAYTYIQSLIAWLNNNYGYKNASYAPPDTNVYDPLDTLLPNQRRRLEWRFFGQSQDGGQQQL